MITLYVFGPLWGLPDPSPFVIKTEVQLQMAGLDFRTEKGRPPQGPKGKVPFIDDNAERIGDSTFIREHIERKYSLDLDAGLSPERRALAWTIERMCEDHLYWAIVYGRWAIDENFTKGPSVFFAGAPEGVMEQARAGMQATLRGQGFGRHSLAEVAALARRSFAALSGLLGDQPYVTGPSISGADATAYATIASALTAHFDTPIRDALLQFPNLLAYHHRMRARFHPQFARRELAAASAA